ncbi:MAG: hypothetical protein HUJ61_06625 [Bacilli bacterium]|nr:hypothetical protein [Bacilli bacterium]
MKALVKASFFRLFKDRTFIITLIIGAILSFLIPLLYRFIDKSAHSGSIFCSGQSLLISSLSPSANFGIAIPVNLVTFIILQFSQGIIRNEVIVGNKRTKIYFSLLISGLAFTLLILIAYVGLSTLAGYLYSGFKWESMIESGGTYYSIYSNEIILKLFLVALFNYILITSFATFISSNLKHVGASISLVLIPIVILSIVPTILAPIYAAIPDNETLKIVVNVFKVLDPFYLIGVTNVSNSLVSYSVGGYKIEDLTFYGSLISSIVYAGLFVFLGILVFNKKDLK